MEALYTNSWGKIKSKKKSLSKENKKKNRPKEERKNSILWGKKKIPFQKRQRLFVLPKEESSVASLFPDTS